MELRQQFPRLGHSDQYRPMLGRSHHASELQALLGVLTIFFYFGANHETSPTAAPQNAKGGDGSTALCPSEGCPRVCVHAPAFGLLPLEPPCEP